LGFNGVKVYQGEKEPTKPIYVAEIQGIYFRELSLHKFFFSLPEFGFVKICGAIFKVIGR